MWQQWRRRRQKGGFGGYSEVKGGNNGDGVERQW